MEATQYSVVEIKTGCHHIRALVIKPDGAILLSLGHDCHDIAKRNMEIADKVVDELNRLLVQSKS